MPYWQESDTFHDDPRWAAAAEGHSITVDQLQAGYTRLKSIAARHGSSGWLTEATALRLCRPVVLERLAATVLPATAPFLHTRGDECVCFEQWQPGYAYLIHQFFVRNPNKRETERHRAQRREREDPRIRAIVYERDAGCCRYCRSGPMRKRGMGRAKDRRVVLHYDHVNPDQLAGEDLSNLVVSCGRCNDEKGARTPYEADMVLLPVPTDAQRRQWLTREECARFDRSDKDEDKAPDKALNKPGGLSRSLSGALSPPVVDAAGAGGEVRPEPADSGQRQPVGLSSEGAGSGRGGQPGVVDAVDELGQPARSAADPDIYHGRSRGRPPGGDE